MYDLPVIYGICVGLIMGLSACYVLLMHYPRYLERAMARKLEKQKVADAITALFDSKVEAKEWDEKMVLKYYRMLGRAWNMPDLIPRKRQMFFGEHGLNLWPSFRDIPNLKETKARVSERLRCMGVDVRTKLNNMRRKTAKEKMLKLP